MTAEERKVTPVAETKTLSVLLDPPTFKALAQAAKQNQRAVSAEARVAILAHLKKEKR